MLCVGSVFHDIVHESRKPCLFGVCAVFLRKNCGALADAFAVVESVIVELFFKKLSVFRKTVIIESVILYISGNLAVEKLGLISAAQLCRADLERLGFNKNESFTLLATIAWI